MDRDHPAKLDRLAEAVADRVMVRLAPFLLGVLDGAGVEAPEARAALVRFLALPPRTPSAEA